MIKGKVASSGSIEIRGQVEVGDDIKTSGKVTIFCSEKKEGQRQGFSVGGKISTSGGVVVEGDLVVE